MADAGERQRAAVRLRRAGLSRSEIAGALGVRTGGEALSRWLKGTETPRWTQRPRAKDELREQAIVLRQSGLSYREIAERVPVSKGTLSAWLRDTPLSEGQRAALATRVSSSTEVRAASLRARAAARRDAIQEEARLEVGCLSERELFVAGIVAYWAEGTKPKPWRTSEQVKFLNSDPDLVALFLAWIRLIGVEPDRLVLRVHIHETADVDGAIQFWSDRLDLPLTQFGKPVLKRHGPTIRHNTGDSYHGCLAVYVRRSASLNIRIGGWCRGLADSLDCPEESER